jgi:hypothetical protein
VSVAAWVNLSAGAGTYPEIVGLNGSIYSSFYVGDEVTPGSNKMDFWIAKAGGGSMQTANPNAISTGSWHLVVGTYDGTNARIYVDGALQSTSATSGATNLSGLLYVGDNFGNSNFWKGLIDDVRVYNRVLSASQIAALYSGGK